MSEWKTVCSYADYAKCKEETEALAKQNNAIDWRVEPIRSVNLYANAYRGQILLTEIKTIIEERNKLKEEAK